MKSTKKLLAILLALVMVLAFAACGDTAKDGQKEPAKEGEKAPEKEGEKAGEKEIALRRTYFAAHGDKAFGRFAVIMDGDKFVQAHIDEFQFGDKDGGNTLVPNSDKAFGEGYAEGKALYSKNANFESYSARMAEKAKATNKLDANYKAIQDFVVGKTVADVEKVIADAPDGKPVDAISGSTLVDTKGYLKGIVEAAKNTAMEAKGKASDSANVKLAFIQGAPHGDKSFADTLVAVEGDKIVAANIDEFQFLKAGTPVPNADKAFGEGFAEGVVLASKKVNSDTYSKNMAEKAKATNTIINNYKAIEEFVVGKTIAEVEKIVADAPDGKPVDAISGSTLVDTKGYLGQIVEAAKLAK